MWGSRGLRPRAGGYAVHCWGQADAGGNAICVLARSRGWSSCWSVVVGVLGGLQRSLALPFCSLFASSAAPLRRLPFGRRSSPSRFGSLFAPLRSSGSVLLPPTHSSLRYRSAAASPLQHRSPPRPPVRGPVNLSGLAVVRSERLRALPLSRGLSLIAVALLILLGRFACAPSLARGRLCWLD